MSMLVELNNHFERPKNVELNLTGSQLEYFRHKLNVPKITKVVATKGEGGFLYWLMVYTGSDNWYRFESYHLEAAINVA